MTYIRKVPPTRYRVNKVRAEGQAAARNGLAVTDNPYGSDGHDSLRLAWDHSYWVAADVIEEPPKVDY